MALFEEAPHEVPSNDERDTLTEDNLDVQETNVDESINQKEETPVEAEEEQDDSTK